MIEAATAIGLELNKEPFVLVSDVESDAVSGVFYGNKEDFENYSLDYVLKYEKHNDAVYAFLMKKKAIEQYIENTQE